ncbi:alpha-hydroxy-acid oxidizing protein [Arthrobacter sp. CDRTa11]|uniref:alpha-hydroxy acid oxidase n=1 Tax=Arthrobacter sp. CDRTa11 TaxID=2651199 RepID=UPI002265BC18|nr:alpha-hydroxy acid oxidase [Arthrobacter sp. CDRTa11]UZX03107.1 alpha-hydroxy-acid oxidizing protein [Arthrobacter sp. CDRTa11]
MRNGTVPPRGLELSHAVNVEDVRAIANRRLPAAVSDFIDGGGEGEITLHRNRHSLDAIMFRPRALSDASTRTLATTMLGTPVSAPLALAPVGLAALAHPLGERAAALAAAGAGIVSTLSSSSCWSLEEVAEATPDAPKWFQIYVWRDRGITSDVVQRARASGYKALVVTVDVPVGARRERDLHNGFTIPPRPTWRHTGDMLGHLPWVARFGWDEMFGHGLTMGNFGGKAAVTQRMAFMERVNQRFDPGMTWDDLEWLRSLWDGPMVVKGITNERDAAEAVARGIDAVWVSNHGGRQLDGLPATIDVLPAVVDAVDGKAEVYMDGGIRRGSDIAKALARGARICMIGRPYIYGLAAKGQAGVTKVIELLKEQLDNTLALLGCASVEALDQDWLRS